MEHANDNVPMTMLRLRDVERVTAMAKSSIYREMGNGFPRPVALSKGCVRWIASEVQEWISTRVAQARAAA